MIRSFRAIVVSAAMGALALVLPVAFHAVGLGSKFLPMLLPLLLNGFLVPVPWAVGTGLIIPWISALATGMPPLYPPVAAVLGLEAAIMGAVASLLYVRWRRSVWMALLPAVIAGRLVSFAAVWLLAGLFALPPAFTATASILQGLPGVALQVTVIPLVVEMLRRRPGLLFSDHRE